MSSAFPSPFPDLVSDERLAAAVAAGSDPVLPSRHALGRFGAGLLAINGLLATDIARQAGGDPGSVTVDLEAGARSLISFGLLRVGDEAIPRTNQSNPWVRLHRCADDRWIHLHGGFPHLVDRLASVLGVAADADHDTIAEVCSRRSSFELEEAIAAERGCGAVVRTAEEWRRHPQGQANAALGPVRSADRGELALAASDPTRPLAGLRVLDLTRVLAGPTCGRTLAAFGAHVVSVRNASLPNVPVFVIDTGWGKAQAAADLRDPDDRAVVAAMARSADVVIQGYRPGVMAAFGLDADSLRGEGFGGVYASISCYGPEGPWADRAGWEQLAQSVAGIAHLEGGAGSVGDKPALVPAAACDYGTGYLTAAAVMAAVARRQACDIDTSLCATADLILRLGTVEPEGASGLGEWTPVEVDSPFGRLSRAPIGLDVEGLDIGWSRPPEPLGTSPLTWER